MPKEIFGTTVERSEGENWGLVVSGGKDMVNFTITIIIFVISFQRSWDWARTNVCEKEMSGDQIWRSKSDDDIIWKMLVVQPKGKYKR